MSDEVEVAVPAPARPVFDSKRPMTTKLPSPEGIKVIQYRYPTDAECCARIRAQRTIIRGLGRGKSQADVLPANDADVALVKTLMNGNGENVDISPAEAGAVLSAALRTRVQSIECTGAAYVVVLKVPGAITTHRLRMPSQDQVDRFREASISDTQGRHNMTEVRASLEPSGALYDALMQGVEGYAGPVPIVHKSTVVAEVCAEIDVLNEEPDPEV